MIDRYSRPQMACLWTEEAKLRTWLDVEILICEGWAKLGKIPQKDLDTIKQKARFDTQKVLESEERTKHDIAAFVSEVQKNIGGAGRFLHLGVTSSDILDTTFSYQLKKSSELLLEDLDQCLALLKERALRDKDVPMIGRTHGMHAEPITMGLKWLYWYELLKRARQRLQTAAVEISVGKVSGVVGTYAHIPPEIEKHVCNQLGLVPDSLSTQVIGRDRYATYFLALAQLGSSVEAIAVELRHLQRTEVGEVQEGFAKGQKGSSAMPHKKNPISAENLTGISRLLRSIAIPALENCALWHERDISHSSVERVIGPDANILADYLLARLHGLLSRLEIVPKRMQANLNLLKGVIFSQPVLLELVESGLSRDEAYEIVQKNSLQALESGVSFAELLKADPKVTKVVSQERLDMVFQPQRYYQYLDHIYKKVL
ncbi:MAG: adenylosuccinate lyase [Deltaproteobacteria bacterium]|nr:adenylosuccinate lyase [Deltaproteobacteria bacterium]